MKQKQFKVERIRIEEVRDHLLNIIRRSKIMISHVLQENSEEGFYFHLLSVYYQSASRLLLEMSKMLEGKEKFFVVPEETIDMVSSCKKTIENIDAVFSLFGRYSLRLH